MYVHWKSLIFLGFLFFLMLCYTDGVNYRSLTSGSVSRYHEAKFQPILESTHVFGKFRHMGTFVIWNFLTFGCSFCVCACLKKITRNFCSIYSSLRTEVQNTVIETEIKERQFSSRIPVLSKSSVRLLKVEDDIIRLKPTESSCPNLLTDKKTEVIRPFCHTIFKNNTMYSSKSRSRNEYSLESKCSKLREELLQIQSNNGTLNRQLDEVTKQLTNSQKENRAAKQQIEELLQEKIMLHQRLESATQEFRSNTKSKKLALAKLEEVTANVDNLKLKLEQTTRDKEILENKLTILQEEYEKLEERLNNTDRNNNNQKRIEIEEPERDENILSVFMEPNFEMSISRTETNVQKVQFKIDCLEEDLKHFNPHTSLEEQDWNTDKTSSKDFDEESEQNFEDPLETPRDEDWSSHDSPRDSNVNETDNIPLCEEYTTSYTNGETTDNLDDSLDESQSSHHIVSSSEAFQNFLKNLSRQNTPKSFFSLSAVNFNDKFPLH